MDVTKEILNNHIIYGASDYTAPNSLAASKSFNYAEGPTIQRPERREISAVPYTINLQSDVGLFGVENYFTKIQLKIVGDTVLACYEEPGWECGKISKRNSEETYWNLAVVDLNYPCETLNTYECPIIKKDSLPESNGDAYLSVDIINNKTGNKHNDNWLDTRLYSKSREEHEYDRMWVRPKDFFYLGIHARNTKRLPFDVSCVIGLEYANYNAIPNKREIMKQ